MDTTKLYLATPQDLAQIASSLSRVDPVTKRVRSTVGKVIDKTYALREIQERLRADGWTEQRQTGSHSIWRHPEKSGRVNIPVHSRDVSRGVRDDVIRNMQLTKQEFFELI